MLAQRVVHWLLVMGSRLMAPFIRRGLLPNSRLGGDLCVLHTRGHQSGRTREASLNYGKAPDGIRLAAALGERTAWYRNILADPRVHVRIEGRWRRGHASVVRAPSERIAALRAVLVGAGVVGRAYGFDPATADDARIERALAGVPAIHVRWLDEPDTGQR